MKGLKEEALEAMQFVYKGNVHADFEVMAANIQTSSTGFSNSNGNGTDDNEHDTLSIFSPQFRSAMVASMGLIVFQQFSGQPSVLSYATVLFQASGWSGNASVATAIFMMAISSTTVMLVDRVGRKRLLGTCCIVMMTALAALSIGFWGCNEEEEERKAADGTAPFGSIQKLVILLAMFVYIGGYQIGFGPVTWCILSEIFPLEIRGKAIAFGVELNYLLNFLVQFAFPSILDSLGWGPTFCFFAIILGFAFFFIRYYVPETTGLTLEEIQVQLGEYSTAGHSPAPERQPLLPSTQLDTATP
jgi:MFS family permease